MLYHVTACGFCQGATVTARERASKKMSGSAPPRLRTLARDERERSVSPHPIAARAASPYSMTIPPVTFIACPVISLASDDARNSVTAAMCSGS